MKVIVIGATSGIGRELVRQMAGAGYDVAATGRRIELLESLQTECDRPIAIQAMDVADTEVARGQFLDLIAQMGGVDIVVLNAGVGEMTTRWEKEKQIMDINATGFAALANVAFHYFAKNNGGQIVGISSVAAVRAGGLSPMYHATKAFISTYMEGLHYRARKKSLPIVVTDIRPGFVKTPMTDQNDPKQMFWVASVEKATQQIVQAIEQKKRVVYITKRWALAARLMRWIPDFIYAKFA